MKEEERMLILDEMDQFPERYKLPHLKTKEITWIVLCLEINQTEFSTRKTSGSVIFSCKFYHKFQEEVIPNLLNLLPEHQGGIRLNHYSTIKVRPKKKTKKTQNYKYSSLTER